MRRAPIELGEQDPDRRGPRGHLDLEKPLHGEGEGELVVEGRQVVHTGDIGAALREVELLRCLLHPGVEIPDDRLRPPDDLSLQLDLEPEHAVGRGVLWPHVEDHPLVFVALVLEHVVVLDDPPELLGETGLRLLLCDLLRPLVGGAELRLLGAGDPDVEGFRGLGVLGHVTRWLSLNWTGTLPTPKSLRRGCPSQSSGIRILVRSG